jgi:hypothetical protein
MFNGRLGNGASMFREFSKRRNKWLAPAVPALFPLSKSQFSFLRFCRRCHKLAGQKREGRMSTLKNTFGEIKAVTSQDLPAK